MYVSFCSNVQVKNHTKLFKLIILCKTSQFKVSFIIITHSIHQNTLTINQYTRWIYKMSK